MVTFVNITEKDFLSERTLFKYMSVDNAFSTLENHSLWFANPTIWDDPFEKRFLEAKYMRGRKESNFKWIGRVFCTCLTQTDSCEAYWKIYSHGNIGIEFCMTGVLYLKN